MPRVTITVPDQALQPYRFDLQRKVVTIGRARENDIVVGCGSVSGKHAEMHRIEGGYELIDLDSTNGTKLDGVRKKKVDLATGMIVKLGDVEFGFTLHEEELATLAAEVEPAAPSFEVEEDLISSQPKTDDQDDFPGLPPIDESKERSSSRKEKKQREIEDDDDDEEERPRARKEKKKKRSRDEDDDDEDDDDKPKGSLFSTKAKWSVGFILFVIVAAALAFFVAADKRHQEETGEGLLKAILNKSEAQKEVPGVE
jgi:pSer/pThr/pTyr-binding forkhead associated (FHA) protein